MNHLNEEQFIDVLMEEPGAAAHRAHLAACATCRDRLETLQLGLTAAREAEPTAPFVLQPTITHHQFERRKKVNRMTWMAAAAVLLLGILGLRLEIGDNKMTLELALFSRGSQSVEAEQRIVELEQQLALTTKAIEIQSNMVQDQIDARFNAFYSDRQKDMQDFNQMVEQHMENNDLQNQRYFLAVQDRLRDELAGDGKKGTLQ